mmetsp:Transcript_116695/g.371250  ORF Transcript_116695/g.371250 Transcript_116695/m.371250 type:complete len:208 (-) Transcript_116695:852-1475(-)
MAPPRPARRVTASTTAAMGTRSRSPAGVGEEAGWRPVAFVAAPPLLLAPPPLLASGGSPLKMAVTASSSPVKACAVPPISCASFGSPSPPPPISAKRSLVTHGSRDTSSIVHRLTGLGINMTESKRRYSFDITSRNCGPPSATNFWQVSMSGRLKGSLPCANAYKITPRPQTSILKGSVSPELPLYTSGAKYASVPASVTVRSLDET